MELSELFTLYDKQIDQNLEFRRRFEAKLDERGLAFHERLIARLGIGPITASVAFTAGLLALHMLAAFLDFGSIGFEMVFRDFSFFIAFVNGLGLFLILSAGDKLRMFVVNLIELSKDEMEVSSDKFYATFKRGFLGKRLVFTSLLFGTINTLLGLLFGIDYLAQGNFIVAATLLFQFFTVGMIGGVSVGGLAVVLKLIKAISVKEVIELRYFYPDKCAGTLIIGNILFHFSLHYILIGIFIFLFIHNFHWINADAYLINQVILFWKLFSFILAGIVFFVPVKRLNSILREYKLQEQWRVRKRMSYIADVVMNLDSDNSETDEQLTILNNHYEKLRSIDSMIQEMNTWPYNLRYRTLFLSIFLPAIIGVMAELSNEWLRTLLAGG